MIRQWNYLYITTILENEMYSVPHVKSMAKAVGKAIKSQSEPLKHQQILDALSQGLGVKNFDVFTAHNKGSEMDFNRINLNSKEVKQYWKDVEAGKYLSKFTKKHLSDSIPYLNSRFNLFLTEKDIITHEKFSDTKGNIEFFELPINISNLEIKMMTPDYDHLENIYICLKDDKNPEFYKNLSSDPISLVDDLEFAINKTLRGDKRSLFERTQPNQKVADLMYDLYKKLAAVSPAKIKEIEDGIYPDEIEIKWNLFHNGKYWEEITVWMGCYNNEDEFHYSINGEGPHKISYFEFSGKVDLIVKNIKKFNRLFSTLNQETLDILKHKEAWHPQVFFDLCPAFNLLKCGFKI